jgi:hypothetical protein
MALIADILMVAGAFGAAVYCFILSGRLKKFTTLESGMGGAIAVLSVQVDDMTKALAAAGMAATGSASNLDALTRRAESVAAKLELLVASMHDIPDEPEALRGHAEADSGFDAPPRARPRVVRNRLGAADMEAAE